MNKLVGIDRLPKPTSDRPYAQIEWIFDKVAELSDWENITRVKSMIVKKKYLKYIANSYKNLPILLSDLWDEMSLLEWRDYLLQEVSKGSIGGKTASLYHNSVSLIMRKCYSWEIISVRPIHIGLPKDILNHRSSDFTAAYGYEYLESITCILRKVIIEASKYSEPYVIKNVGQDPRLDNIQDVLVRARGYLHGIECQSSWKSWDNIIYYFENNLKGRVPYQHELSAKDLARYQSTISKYHGDIETVWEKLGVLSGNRRRKLIFSLTLCLAYETGLNLSSLKSLRIDCYQDAHELTRQPYLKYYKRRSGGSKELHFSIFRNDDNVKSVSSVSHGENNCLCLWLNETKSIRVKKIVDLLLSLTEDTRQRHDLPKQFEDKLIIWPSGVTFKNRSKYGCLDSGELGSASLRRFIYTDIKPALIRETIHRLSANKSHTEMATNANKIRRDVMSQSFTVSRFRATLATEMVKNGASVEEIQAFLGHAKLYTTLLYIRQHDLEISFYKDINRHLNIIKRNTSHYKHQVHATSSSRSKRAPYQSGFETGLGVCLDPYESVTKKHYSDEENIPCRSWNQCLFCHKILITVHCLPKLFAYRIRLKQSLSNSFARSNQKVTPILRAISIIDSIEHSRIFTSIELQRARLSAETIDYELLDMMLIHGSARH